jgi:hypothetical protein
MRAWPHGTGSAPIVDYLSAVGACVRRYACAGRLAGRPSGQGGFKVHSIRRPRATLDAEVWTAQVIQRALAAGHGRRLWSALRDLDAAAGSPRFEGNPVSC